MTATDTVVGIVGAVLLVGVMTGVFVYEYNQVGDGGGTDTPGTANATEAFSGSFDPQLGLTGPTVVAEETVEVNASVVRLQAEGTLTANADGGSLTIQFVDPDGEATDVTVDGGGSGPFVLGLEDPAPGTWTLRFSTDTFHPGGSYDGHFGLTYDTA